jgi:tetratricopeptide (TPR) repeat protein
MALLKKQSDKYWFIFICAVMTLVTLAVYWQMHRYDFVNFDDYYYVCKNPHVLSGLTADGVIWAFTTDVSSHWHPLTWLSLMLDCQLFGPHPAGFHLVNLLLHIVNTLLLFTVLKKMTGALWQSAFVAALFALHPLHVESVAWISGRKDVLSALFWFLTMGAYLAYVRCPGAFRYTVTLVLFALGLMAKPMLVTLPFVFLLLDYWPLDRIKHFNRQNIYRLVLEKIPFFALVAVSSAVTFLVMRSSGTVIKMGKLSLNSRIANAVLSYVKYLYKMVWPQNLAAFYPLNAGSIPFWQVMMCALLLLGISIFVIRFGRNQKYLPVGWFWFIGTLIPVIGIIQVGSQGYADRYTYIPLTGLFIIIAWGFTDLSAKWKYRQIILGASAAIILSAMAVCTFFQAGYWRNSISLFEHTLEITKDNYMAHQSLAEALHDQGKTEQAIEHCHKALQIDKNFVPANISLGALMNDQGKNDEAIQYLTTAIQLDPAGRAYGEAGRAYGELGRAMADKGKMSEAVALFEKAIELEPDWVNPINALAWNLATYNDAKIRNPVRALQLAKRASELVSYENPAILNTLAVAYAANGDFARAIEIAEKALKLCAADQNALKKEIENQLILYKAGKPYIEAQ